MINVPMHIPGRGHRADWCSPLHADISYQSLWPLKSLVIYLHLNAVSSNAVPNITFLVHVRYSKETKCQTTVPVIIGRPVHAFWTKLPSVKKRFHGDGIQASQVDPNTGQTSTNAADSRKKERKGIYYKKGKQNYTGTSIRNNHKKNSPNYLLETWWTDFTKKDNRRCIVGQ